MTKMVVVIVIVNNDARTIAFLMVWFKRRDSHAGMRGFSMPARWHIVRVNTTVWHNSSTVLLVIVVIVLVTNDARAITCLMVVASHRWQAWLSMLAKWHIVTVNTTVRHESSPASTSNRQRCVFQICRQKQIIGHHDCGLWELTSAELELKG